MLPLLALAQTRPGLVGFQRIAMPDDVPAHLATAMAQDAQGFLWIGTQDGLVRHDGYGFKVYRPRPGDATSLSGSYVRALHVARDGRLWVGSISGGVSVFDPRTEGFRQYRHRDGDESSLAHDRVESVAEDRDGGLWIATDNGLDRLDPASGAIRHHRHDAARANSLAHDQLRALLIDRAGRLWVGGRGGLQQWRGEAEGFVAVAKDELAGQHVTRLLEDSQGRIWIGTAAHGLAVLDPAGPAVLKRWPPGQGGEALSHYWVYGLAEGAGGEIWVATFGGGVDVIDGSSLRIVDRLRHDAGQPATIGNDRVGAVLADRSGLMWVGSWGGGLARHDPATRAWLKLRHRAGDADGPSHPAIVRAREMTDGRLWLGTNGNGVDILDAAGHLIDGLRPEPKKPDALADGSVTCLAQGPDGSAWVATLDGSLHRQRPGRRGFERITTAQGLPGGPIRTMVFDAAGALWTGSLSGLARIATDGTVTAFRHDPADATTLAGRAVESLAFASDGKLWVGSDNGLSLFDPATAQARRIARDPARADALPNNWVPDLLVARDGRLWVATPDGVAILKSFDGGVARFDVLSRRLDLPSSPAESLVEDAEGQVWLGSRVRIDPKTWRVQRFDAAEGNEFRSLFIASRAMTHDGRLLFGSPEGLLIVQPRDIQPWTYAPPLRATAISVDGETLPADRQALTLQPGQRSLRVEFAALDLTAPQKLRYRYRLEGFDRDWNAAAADQRLAAYTGLPPGRYQLLVQGSNRAGRWSEPPLSLAVQVMPALHQTWWFRAAIALLALLLIVAVFRLRLRALRRRGAELERVVAERTADLQAAYQRIEQASLTDPLTGLHNRRFLEQTLPADLELAARRHTAGHPVPPDSDHVLLMLDLDHFKSVNDTHGHAAGDAVLVQTAEVLRQALRASDYVVRWGGEEFLVVARFVERASAPQLAEKIRMAIAAHEFRLPDGSPQHKTVSIGFACFPFAAGGPGASALDSLQHLADLALYAAKRSWRDAWVGVELVGEDVVAALRESFASPAAAEQAGWLRVSASTRDTPLRWR
ncbi:two-component regulator propeller domain-containing protein [Roseateles sp. NT4]|uniref:two-component regulator propeller domain-containing protein n=1 Tax=Roseateles sp. NT4 TaxID=3453715 RepID=UPI003EEB69B2